MFEDPVCKMMDEKTAKHLSKFKGKKIFFCSEKCEKNIINNPKKFG